ncbi:MAG: hypothetical protein ACP5QG_07225 [candidate division WOR-3 bacterium]
MKEIPEHAFIIHKHRAKRAGVHFDLRVKEGDGVFVLVHTGDNRFIFMRGKE